MLHGVSDSFIYRNVPQSLHAKEIFNCGKSEVKSDLAIEALTLLPLYQLLTNWLMKSSKSDELPIGFIGV